MNIAVDAFFDNAFVISINKARLDEFYSVFREYFPNCARLPRHFRGPQSKNHSNLYNSLEAHAAVARMAETLDLPFVVIFEDDAYPCVGADKILEELLENMPDPECTSGIVQLGWIYRSGDLSEVCSHEGNSSGMYRILRSGDCYGMHAYVVMKRAYRKLIETYERKWQMPVPSLFRRLGPYLTLDCPMFIQRQITRGTHYGVGYIYGDAKVHQKCPIGFKMRGEVLKQRDEQSKGELRRLIKDTGLSGIVMVEVGSYAGESADAFAGMDEVSKIYCVDPWQPDYDDNDSASRTTSFEKVEQAFDKVAEKWPDKIVKFKGTLQEFQDQHGKIDVDLVYIDGCHRYDCVKADISTARSMKPRYIAGHDYNVCLPGVIKAVKEAFSRPDRIYGECSWIKKMEAHNAS